MLVLDAGMGRELAERLPEEAWRLGHGVGRHLVLDAQHAPLRVEEQRLRPLAVDRTPAVASHRSRGSPSPRARRVGRRPRRRDRIRRGRSRRSPPVPSCRTRSVPGRARPRAGWPPVGVPAPRPRGLAGGAPVRGRSGGVEAEGRGHQEHDDNQEDEAVPMIPGTPSPSPVGRGRAVGQPWASPLNTDGVGPLVAPILDPPAPRARSGGRVSVTVPTSRRSRRPRRPFRHARVIDQGTDDSPDPGPRSSPGATPRASASRHIVAVAGYAPLR